MSPKTKKLEPIHPGEILLEEFMKPMGVSINRLAREVMVPPNRISGIVNSGRSITADTALRLGKYFGVTPETWLNLQRDYDLRLAQNAGWPQVEPRIQPHAPLDPPAAKESQMAHAHEAPASYGSKKTRR